MAVIRNCRTNEVKWYEGSKVTEEIFAEFVDEEEEMESLNKKSDIYDVILVTTNPSLKKFYNMRIRSLCYFLDTLQQ